jgi:hypothetical protein
VGIAVERTGRGDTWPAAGATNQQLSEQLAKRAPDDGFTFNAYARSGMLVNSHGKGAHEPSLKVSFLPKLSSA